MDAILNKQKDIEIGILKQENTELKARIKFLEGISIGLESRVISLQNNLDTVKRNIKI